MHQPLRYWEGPPPFAPFAGVSPPVGTYGVGNRGAWTGGGGSFGGAGASAPFTSGQLSIFSNPANQTNQATPLASGLICILSADNRLVPLVPQQGAAGSSPFGTDASPLANGLVCLLSNGQMITMSQQPATGPFATGQSAPMATGSICMWSTDGKIIPMNMCGG